jgi:hypothetical protein
MMVKDSVKFLVDAMLKADGGATSRDDRDAGSCAETIRLENELSAVQYRNCFMC